MKAAFHGHENAEPIGLEYVGSAIARLGVQTKFYGRQELRAFLPGTKEQLALFGPTTAEYNHVLAAAEKARQEGCVTVIGGFHASGVPEEAAVGPFDYVVVGEGEDVASALASQILLGNCAKVPGEITETKAGAKIIKASRIRNLDGLAWPLRKSEFLGSYNFCDFMWPPSSMRSNMALVLASRGCKNNCSFCASRAVFGQGVSYRSPNDVVAELRTLKEDFNTNAIVFIDQSLGQDLDWTKRLCAAIKQAHLGMRWYHQSNLTVSNEAIKEMAEAGCSKIGFGLESLSLSSMARVKPVNPLDFGKVNEKLDYCNALGVFVKLYVIIGFPWETHADMSEYMKCISILRANEVKISFFTPFPGLTDWGLYRNQIDVSDRSLHDTAHYPTVKNPGISKDEYIHVREELFHAFYGSNTYTDVTAKMLRRYPYYRVSYQEFAQYLRDFQMVTGNESWLKCL